MRLLASRCRPCTLTRSTCDAGIDYKSMQDILDSGRSILMSVDHGMTRLARDSFMHALDVVMSALLPKPFVVLAVGDETNRVSTAYVLLVVQPLKRTCFTHSEIAAAARITASRRKTFPS